MRLHGGPCYPLSTRSMYKIITAPPNKHIYTFPKSTKALGPKSSSRRSTSIENLNSHVIQIQNTAINLETALEML